MFAPSILRRQALRAFSPSPRKSFIAFQQRSQHTVPPLSHHKDDVPGLFSREAFKVAWTDYQHGLVERLNYLTAGAVLPGPGIGFARGVYGIDKVDIADKEYKDNTASEIAIITARQAELAATFNYASQAHNNHFFFESLASKETKIPDNILTYIPDTFASVDAMKTEILATAEAMFGCGWVWLVLDHGKRLRILCTYNAGTPYGEAYRRQDTDKNTGEKLGSPDYMFATRNAVRGSGAQYILPLLNVNCWEHAWITDYGVLGKRDYLENWWNSVNWDVVASRLGKTISGSLRQPYDS